MPELVTQLLASFDRLSMDEQKVAALEIVKRVKTRGLRLDEGPILDDDIVRMGDELFQMYDREEARHGTAETW